MSDENDAPCGCCRRIDGYWIANCGCDNGGDLEDAVAWCGDQNRGAEVVALRAEVERLRGELQEWVAHYEDGLVTGGAGLYARTRDALKEQSDEEGAAYSRVMGAVLEQSDE